jgi:hypothetical protein
MACKKGETYQLVLILKVVTFVHVCCVLYVALISVFIAPRVQLLHNFAEVCNILVGKPYAKRPLGR